jgi:hypothetical protein
MAVSSVVLCVEGVMQKNTSLAPIPLGIGLYHGLSSVFSVLLISGNDKKQTDHWLALEALNRHSAAEYNEGVRIFMDEEQRKAHQVDSLRVRGFNIDLVIDPDPGSAINLLNSGFNVMTFTHSAYALPQWRPDHVEKVRSWDDIVAYEDQMARLRAVDKRLNDKEKDSL